MLLPTHSTHILPLRDKVADELGVISKVNVPAPWWSSLRRSCAPYISTWITNTWTKVCRVSTLCQRWTRQWQSWPEPRANLLRIVSFGRSPYPPTQNSWLPPSRRSDNFALTLGLPAHRRSGWVPSCQASTAYYAKWMMFWFQTQLSRAWQETLCSPPQNHSTPRSVSNGFEVWSSWATPSIRMASDPKTSAINDMKAPTTVTKLRTFMGMVKQLGKFIHTSVDPTHPAAERVTQ